MTDQTEMRWLCDGCHATTALPFLSHDRSRMLCPACAEEETEPPC